MNKLFAKSIIGFAIASVAIIAPVSAQSSLEASVKIKDSALKSNIIGESVSGYLEFVKVPTPSQVDISRAVNEINAERKKVYINMSRERGISVDKFALTSALVQIRDKTPNGQYFKDQDGQWCIKTDKAKIDVTNDLITIQCQ